MFVVDCQDDVTGPAVVDQDHLCRASLGPGEFFLDSPVYQEGHLFVDRCLFVVPGDDDLTVSDVSFPAFISESCSGGSVLLPLGDFDPNFGLLLDVEVLGAIGGCSHCIPFDARFGLSNRFRSRCGRVGKRSQTSQDPFQTVDNPLP